MLRHYVSIVLFVFIIFFPYWIYVPVLFGSVIFLPFYFEAIIFAFLIEVLYGTQVDTGISFYFPLVIMVTILVLILLPIQKHLRLNA